MAVKKDLTLEKHAAFKEIITVTDDGKPVDLTGWDAALQVRAIPEAPLTILDLSTDSGHIEVDDLGQIGVVVPADQTGVLPAGVFVYDLVIYASRDAIRVCEGRFRIEEGVTRWESQ